MKHIMKLILSASMFFIISGLFSGQNLNDTSKITYIKPLNMRIFTSRIAKVIKLEGGYNSEVWDHNKGFSVAKMKQVDRYFPTTGFKGAEFDVIGSGDNQIIYRCLTNSSWIKLSNDSDSDDIGQNCHAIFITETKPTQPAIIEMEQKIGNKWVKIDSYTIQVPKKWAIPVQEQIQYADADLDKATKFPALDRCRTIGSNADYDTTTWQQGAGQNPSDKAFRQKYMYRRDELSNSPYADLTKYPEGNSGYDYQANISIRDVDSTFTGEWGSLDGYKESGFYYLWNWSVETNSDSKQFFTAQNGYVGAESPYQLLGVICRGE